MSRLECDSCGDLVDVSWRTTTLPYICQRCTKDSALAIEAEDNIPCDDATTYYIIEARGKFKSYDWFRSQNPGTEGVFDDYSTALDAAEREQDGSSIEYRVVEYRPEPTPCDAPYNSGVPCQSALDSVQEEQFDMDANSDINQFDADTELINGLLAENDDLKMQLSQANLNIQIQGEIIADLENTVGAYRVIFRIPGY